MGSGRQLRDKAADRLAPGWLRSAQGLFFQKSRSMSMTKIKKGASAAWFVS